MQTQTRILPTLAWTIVAILLLFFVFTHLGVLICFITEKAVPRFVAPAALILALAVSDWLARREGLRAQWRILPPAIALVVSVLALVLAASFFDMSWDGLWYHQTAVYQMSHGWNPLRDSMHDFDPRLQDWVRYYAKGPWYVALALFQTTHHIEWAKAAPWMAMVATFLAVLAACAEFGFHPGAAIVIAALVCLNPVITCQLASFLVDGLMVSFLACFVAALFCWFKRPSRLIVVIALCSAILCINAKLTGVVYLCFVSAGAGIYTLVKRRDVFWRHAAIQVSAMLLGTLVFGFNPYVTNTWHRGNPLYPWLGSAKYPSFAQRHQDPNELYETPTNMMGHSRFFRLYYAIFSHPGPQAFLQAVDAQLMWPFDIGWKDVTVFRFHEVRIAGFGPLFSGALLLSLILLGIALVHPAMPRGVLLLMTSMLVASLLISVHTWWARYGPQLWWLPVFAVIAGLVVPNWRAVRWAAWGMAALLMINAALVGFAHFQWEIQATRTTLAQLATLRTKGEIQVDLQYFREPFGERLRAAGVTFREVPRLPRKNTIELMSVVPGYPGAVRAHFETPPHS